MTTIIDFFYTNDWWICLLVGFFLGGFLGRMLLVRHICHIGNAMLEDGDIRCWIRTNVTPKELNDAKAILFTMVDYSTDEDAL